MEIENLTEIQR